MGTTATLTNLSTIPLTAVISGTTGYTIRVDYGSLQDVTVIYDNFYNVSLPSTVTVEITSTTVPAGYTLSVEGGGSWSGLTGTFALDPDEGVVSAFTLVLTPPLGGGDPITHDPRLMVRKIVTED